MTHPLDKHLAQFCAPTLLGAKAASLVSLSREEFPELEVQVRDYSRQFAPCGLVFQVLWSYRRRSLLFVYRPNLLRQNLREPAAAALLEQLGYQRDGSVEEYLGQLRRRFGDADGFPHEIGLFLDYPAEDVAAFIATGGSGCKLCGYWKVYHDVEAARERFACYDACRLCLCRMLEAGSTISQLLQAA